MFAKRVRDILDGAEPETKIEISGWVRTIRQFPEFSFIELNDGSCLKGLQIIADKTLDCYETVNALGTGASITVRGMIKASEGKGQRVE
jgi:asparaginyl-tRNA synthetase